jgi:tRNA pseudouridine synthase 10
MDNKNEKENKILATVLSNNKICDFCIGRLFTISKNDKNYQKNGKEIRESYKIKKILMKNCELCDGIFKEVSLYKKMIFNTLTSYEFNSFVIGFKIDEDLIKREQKIISLFDNFSGESIKNTLQRIIGLYIERKTNIPVNFEHPDIMIIFNTMFNAISLQIKPLYIYGRYNKFERGIPQTKWFCRTCRGKGCKRCNYTGTLYKTSIEELIKTPFIQQTEGQDESFHGSGREDIDVRMLGNGRPFVLEIIEPKIRTINLEYVQNIINKSTRIQISELQFTNKNEIKRLKEAKFHKVYHVKIQGKKRFKTENLKKVALALRGKIIEQFTPTRVEKRRANKIRKRQIYNCTVLEVDGAMATFAIESESGTYIKELVTGDDGKTKPNISELIGQPCTVVNLDVMEIKGE